MGWTHPIGDDHPFRAVYALAEAEGYDALDIVDVYDGALIRLFGTEVDIVFRLQGDPGSAMDRQRFDYHEKVRIDPAPPQQMLDTIKAQIAKGAKPARIPRPEHVGESARKDRA